MSYLDSCGIANKLMTFIYFEENVFYSISIFYEKFYLAPYV